MLGLLPIEIVERALLDKGPDMILILAKAAGCTWTTTKAMLAMNAADRGLSKQEMAEAQKSYERLSRETARRLVKFHERRSRLSAAANTVATVETSPRQQRAVASDAGQSARAIHNQPAARLPHTESLELEGL